MLPKKSSSIVVLRGKVFVGSSRSKSERVVVALLLWWLRVKAFVSGAITPSFSGSLRISLSFVDTSTYENTYKHYCALVHLVVIVNYINKIAPFHKLTYRTRCVSEIRLLKTWIQIWLTYFKWNKPIPVCMVCPKMHRFPDAGHHFCLQRYVCRGVL